MWADTDEHTRMINMTAVKRMLFLLLLVPSMMTGCSAIEEYKNDCCSACQDRMQSWRVWQRVKHCYADQPNIKAFAEGFRAGYIHIKNGGNGCPPLLPPRKYWNSCCYRGCHGQAASVSWFNGFSQGVTQALYDGVAGCNQIVTSRDLYGCQCEETIDISAMLEHVRENGSMSEPTWAQPGFGSPEDPTFEWTPQPLPQGAYDNLQEAEGIWDEDLFRPSGSDGFDTPLLEPIEPLPTEDSEDAVSPALIEFLDPFEPTE